MLFVYLAIMAVYMLPGLALARGMYAEQIRQVRNQPVIKPLPPIPPKPNRPPYKLNEQLHDIGICGRLETPKRNACNCTRRGEWLSIKNAWADYDEWQSKYGGYTDAQIAARNAKVTEYRVNMKAIYAAVPLWPLAGAGMFIKGGAKNIPDYRAIERMEQEEARAIESKLKEIE